MNFDTSFLHRFLSAGSIIGLAMLVAIGCDKNDKQSSPPTAPIVTTAALTNVTTSGATAGGSIVSDGGAAVTTSGIVWSKSNATPTLADSVIAGTTANGTFTSEISGLEFNTSYYIRAFATNSVGTGYGEVVTLNTTNDTNKVRFIYNGEEVVYGIIVSPISGRKWLDRNLGAQQVATSYDDYKAYGDLFQWGRPADGHQLINWTSPPTAGTPVNGTTTTLATSDVPGHSNFIIYPDVFPYTDDWRDDNNHNRWGTIPQGPCPPGWHVPTSAEWMAEESTTQGGTATSGGMENILDAYNLLKLTSAGRRKKDGSVISGSAGHYWSTSEEIIPDTEYGNRSSAVEFNPGLDYIQTYGEFKAIAESVRCIKD
jgi:uncharacterized protein (TIGR02145 family)